MSSKTWVRSRSHLILIAVLILPLFGGCTSKASADEVRYEKVQKLSYRCLLGQAVVATPGKVQTDGYIKRAFLWVESTKLQRNARYYQADLTGKNPTEFLAKSLRRLGSNGDGVIRVKFRVFATGNITFGRSTWACQGAPTNSDGDMLPDELDSCSKVAGDRSNGCPRPSKIVLVATHPSHRFETDGSATLKVIKPTDKYPGATRYVVSTDLGAERTTRLLKDGETSPDHTFRSLGPGKRIFCADGRDGTRSCIKATIPRDSTPKYAGKASFVKTCNGLTAVVVNTGWKQPEFVIQLRTFWGHPYDSLTRQLDPGEPMSLFTGRRWHAKAQVYRIAEDGSWISLGEDVWTVPKGCAPMVGGTSLMWWGDLPQTGSPKAYVKTKAYQTRIGVQTWRGGPIHWASSFLEAGDHTVQLPQVWVGTKRCYALWEVHRDGAGAKIGKRRFTGFRCYERLGVIAIY